jgi:hypothetical protein
LLREHARIAFGNLWNPARRLPAPPPEPPVMWRAFLREFWIEQQDPDPEQVRRWDEESNRRRRSIAAAIGRAEQSWSTIVIDGSERRAFRIVHPRLFAVTAAIPGGLATVSGRGVTLDELELTLAPDAGELLGVPPGPWDDL